MAEQECVGQYDWEEHRVLMISCESSKRVYSSLGPILCITGRDDGVAGGV